MANQVLFTTTQVAAFPVTVLTALSTTVINALSPAQFAALTTTQVSGLQTTQLTALNSSSAVSLNSTQVAALSTTQIASLVIVASPSANPAFPQNMGMPAIINTVSAGNNFTQIANMKVLDIGGPNGSQYSHAAAYPLGTLAAAQATGLFKSADGVTVIPLSVVTMAAQTVTSTAGLTPTVYTHIDSTAISESNPLKIDHGELLLAFDAAPPTGGVAHVVQRMGY